VDGLTDSKDKSEIKKFEQDMQFMYRDESPMNVRTSGAKKTDTGKRRFSLLPVQPLLDAIDVLEFGAKRYGDFNWQKGFEWTGIYNAAQRHMHAWLDGEDNADDSNLPHLAHAMVNMMFLLVFRNTHKEMDDRPSKKGQ
jgi:hypothetical protein